MVRILIAFGILVLVEVYGFMGIKNLFAPDSGGRKVAIAVYLAFTTFMWVAFITYRSWGQYQLSREAKAIFATLFIAFTVAKLVAAVFFLGEDITRVIRTAFNYMSGSGDKEALRVSRSAFLNKLAIGAAAVPFGAFIYGAINNAYNYQFKKVTLKFPNLPAAFDGFTLVQLSDIHSGSFTRTLPIQEVIGKINALNADAICFTGDLVNNEATEMKDYISVFNQLRSKHGVYSITGNHDYGDYVQWDSPEAKKANFAKLVNTHKEMGWDILMNEHRILERNGEKIAILGIENWGAKMHFPKYGKMPQAYKGTEDIPFKVLLSHDPSHWDAQVRNEYKDIDLTLSGHTHGFQFGIENKWIKWSPVQFAYKQWAGLYQEGKQYLYVNRGFGFLGYPGRIGILPEVTVFEFKKG
jgi:predicted MPP superfamily phosphohydrolase